MILLYCFIKQNDGYSHHIATEQAYLLASFTTKANAEAYKKLFEAEPFIVKRKYGAYGMPALMHTMGKTIFDGLEPVIACQTQEQAKQLCKLLKIKAGGKFMLNAVA